MAKPRYITSADQLRQLIFSGAFPDDRLPTEPSLAASLGISRATLREALKQLESEDLILRRHGIGTFIRTRTPSISLAISIPRSITAMIDAMGLIPGTRDMRVTTETVFPDDVERLGVNPGTEVYRIERVRTANGQPVAYTIDLVPGWAMRRYPEWSEGENFSLIEHLTYRCGLTLEATSYALNPLHNVKSVADKLEIDMSSHIFFFEGVDHDTGQAPVLFSREYFAPWIFRFTVERTPEI